jgi:Na+/H+-dicarboxylate symporter
VRAFALEVRVKHSLHLNNNTKKRLHPALGIPIAKVLGTYISYMIYGEFQDPKGAAQVAVYKSIISDIFLRLIKMLIGPLVFSTLVLGLAHMGDASSVASLPK